MIQRLWVGIENEAATVQDNNLTPQYAVKIIEKGNTNSYTLMFITVLYSIAKG